MCALVWETGKSVPKRDNSETHSQCNQYGFDVVSICMKTAFLPLALSFTLTRLVLAQDAVPLERARDIAQKVNASLGRIDDAPFAVDADTSKPQAIHADKVGLLIIPDKGLNSEALANPGKDILPIGQLWLLHAVVADGERAAAKEKLRNILVEDNEREQNVQLYLLGLRKNARDSFELVVYGKGKEPIVATSMVSAPNTQEFPLQVTGRKESDTSGILTIHLLGQYSADLRLVRGEE